MTSSSLDLESNLYRTPPYSCLFCSMCTRGDCSL